MRKAFGLRRAAPILVAIVVHALFGLALLSRPPEPVSRDIVMEVVLAPPWRPEAARDRPLRAPPQPNQAPAAARAETPATPAPSRRAQAADWRVRDPGEREEDAVRRSLRAGVGCRSADFLALTKAERQACDDRLAAGAAVGPVYAVVSPRLKKEFDGVFECPKDDAWCEYRVGKAPYPGLFAPRRKKRTEWD